MAGITTAMCSSFKQELLEGKHNFTASTGSAFKMALFKSGVAGTYGSTTANYSSMSADEVASGGGYTTGGQALTNVTPLVTDPVAYTTFGANPSWTSATFSSDGAEIYNTSNSNSTVGVWSFGGTQSVTSGTFTVLMPTNNSSSALIRLG
jgi:hypothetical protein